MFLVEFKPGEAILMISLGLNGSRRGSEVGNLTELAAVQEMHEDLDALRDPQVREALSAGARTMGHRHGASEIARVVIEASSD